jgi:replicative DNA helicase
VATATILSRSEGRLQPQDLEAETSVLGAILLDQAAITRVLDFLNPDDFYRENNGQIYRAALNLFREGEPIDNVTLASELEKLGVLERIGGRAHLALLQEAVPTAANVEHYARIVKDKAYKRRLIVAGSHVTGLGFDDSLDAEEAVNQAQAHVYAISDDKVGTGMERIYDLLKPAMDRIDAQMASGGGVVGIATGFHDIDRLTNGFKPSDLIVVAGRPSMGKCVRGDTLIVDPGSGARLNVEEAVRRRLPTVMGVDGAGLVRSTPVAAWVDSGVQPCYRLATRSGRSIEVTHHHPFLTPRGWEPLHDIRVGAQVAIARSLPCFGRDGSAGLDRARNLGREVVAAGVRAPAAVWTWDRDHLREFVLGVTSGAREDRASGGLAVKSRELASDIQHALTRFGVVSQLADGAAGRWHLVVMEKMSVESVEGVPAGSRSGRQGVVRASGQAPPMAFARGDSPDLFWDEVVSVEPTGEHHVYDLTVPDGANFIAADMVVHNTSFALNVGLHAAVEHKKPVAIFSLEMSKEQLVERMLCEQARIDAQRLHRGMLSDVEYERLAGALGPLGDAPIFIDDSPTLDDLTMRLKARQAKSREGIEMIVLDYLQLMHGRSGGDDHNRVQEVSAISRGLKAIARELRIPVLAISQLSRAPEARPDKRPILSDLRESGCMPASTRLLRADDNQEVTLGDLVLTQQQPLVWSLDKNWRLVPRRLLNAFPSGIKPVYRLRLASGYEVDATANHQFRAVDAWKRLDELAVGACIAVPRRLPASAEHHRWDEDELVLLAHLLGDGSLGPGIKYATGVDALDQHGLWGRRAPDKFVPEALYSLPTDQVGLFLRHLWATEGSITLCRNGKGPVVRIYYASVSKALVEGVRRLLLRLDVRGRVSCFRKDVTGAEDMMRFLAIVGSHGERGDIAPDCTEVLSSQKPNPNAALATSDVFWDEVVEISPLGDMPTFDATVEETHNFVANGVIAHNSIEQDADLVMFLYRDEYYNGPKSEKPGIAEVLIAKHRNGPTGSVELAFRRELTRFENLEKRHVKPEPD